MPYLIDGHNLIPHLPGLSLSQLDDEMRLVGWLQAFHRQTHKQVEVYFDKAPPGFAGRRQVGSVTAIFVREGLTADEALRRRLAGLGRAARNWTVVSSDHQVQAEARATRAQVLSSDAFASQLVQLAREQPPGEAKSGVSEADIQEWLDLFGGKGNADKSE